MQVRETVILFGCLVVAIILHEISHGVVALWCGDDTAKQAGRLTLNPIPHIDPFGSLILPAMGAIAGLPVIGYAKPVPVDPRLLRSPRRDMVFVSLAGPTTNFLLMAVAAVVARFLFEQAHGLGDSFGAASSNLPFEIAFYFAVVNMLLGLFNLLPIPPLDGSALLERALPAQWLPTWYRFRPYGLAIIFALVFFTGIVTTVMTPFFNALYDFVIS